MRTPIIAAGILLAALAFTLITPAPSVVAHEAQCPLCKLDVVQDTATQDNEVALKFGRKRIEYRCVFCAVSQAKTEFGGDLTILAPSEIKAKPVQLVRKGGMWSVTPETTVFVAKKDSHQRCQITYRAFTTEAAFRAYAARNKEVLGDTQPLKLAEFIDSVK